MLGAFVAASLIMLTIEIACVFKAALSLLFQHFTMVSLRGTSTSRRALSP